MYLFHYLYYYISQLYKYLINKLSVWKKNYIVCRYAFMPE